MPDLTTDEAAEMSQLEGEMADSHGRHFDGHWGDHYTHNVAKQQRYGELLQRRDGGARDEQLPGPAHGVDERVGKIMKHPDYWKSEALQAKARAILESDERRPGQTLAHTRASDVPTETHVLDDGSEVTVPTAAVDAIEQMGTEWAPALEITEDQSADLLERLVSIQSEVGDMGDLDASFDGLSDAAQWALFRFLADPSPEGVATTINRIDDATLDECEFWLGALPPAEEQAIRRAVGL